MISLSHLVSKYKVAAEMNLTQLYFLGEPGNDFSLRNHFQRQNSHEFSTMNFDIFKMKPSAII